MPMVSIQSAKLFKNWSHDSLNNCSIFSKSCTKILITPEHRDINNVNLVIVIVGLHKSPQVCHMSDHLLTLPV